MGDLDGAERCYHSAFDQNPDHPDAWHRLSVVALHWGRHAFDLGHIRRALDL